MSLLNVVVWPDRVLVGVDTLVVDHLGKREEFNKFMLIPSTNVIFAARGTSMLVHIVYALCFNKSEEGWQFDDYVNNIPAFFLACWRNIEASALRDGVPASFMRRDQEVVVAGWSAKRNRMIVIRFSKAADSDDLQKKEISGASFGPAAPFAEALPEIPSTADEMLPIAREQVRWMYATTPNEATGGRLLVAEITREQAIVRSVGQLA